VMVAPVGSSSLLQSSLALFHSAGNDALASASQLSAGSSERVHGLVGLQAARQAAELGRVVSQVAQAVDQALFDILA
jgi:hypothetical protein